MYLIHFGKYFFLLKLVLSGQQGHSAYCQVVGMHVRQKLTQLR